MRTKKTVVTVGAGISSKDLFWLMLGAVAFAWFMMGYYMREAKANQPIIHMRQLQCIPNKNGGENLN